jgi:hypothetical protein
VQHLLLGNTKQTANGVTTRPGPTLDLNFAASLNTVDQVSGKNLVSFTRTTSGTYFDSAGVLRSAAVNLLLRSEEFNALPWATQSTPPTITANTAVSPNETLTADTITFASADSRLQSDTISFTAGVAYTFSIYARAVGTSLNKFRLAFFDGAQQNSADFTVSNLTWTRITATFIAANTALGRVQIRNATDVLANSLFFWGAQLETGSVATAYIPTTSAVNSAPRFDHNPITGESLGLLVEEPRTNLALYSQAITLVNWGFQQALSTTLNAATSPDGSSNATLMFENTQNANRFIGQAIGVTNAAHTVSIFAKAKERKRIMFRESSVSGTSATFDLQSGTVVGSEGSPITSIQPFRDGWYRCVMTYTPSSASTRTHSVYLMPDSGTSFATSTYTGDGTSGVFLFGFGVEAGAFPSSYIPTTTGTFTRSADFAQIIGSNFGVTRTNLLSRSEEFDNASWTKTQLNAFGSGSIANAIAAPNGSVTADLITENTATTIHRVSQDTIGGTAALGTYAASVYFKAKERSRCYLNYTDNATGEVTAIFNLSNQSSSITTGGSWTGSLASIQSVGDGWYRCSLTATKGNSAFALNLRIGIADDSSNVSYTGNGTSGIYLWGAQLETGSVATPYIPTTTTTASVFDSWYRQSEGTLFAEWIRGYSGNFTNFTSPANLTNNLSGASANNIAAMATNGTNLQIYQTMATGGAEQLDYAFENAATRNKTVQAYRLNDSQSAINGILKNADTSCTPPSGLDRLNIGSGAIGTAYINSHIRRITYYPVRIPSALLQAITI